VIEIFEIRHALRGEFERVPPVRIVCQRRFVVTDDEVEAVRATARPA